MQSSNQILSNKTFPRISLPEIDKIFLGLSSRDQILLLDHLLELGDIEMDIQGAALDWAKNHSSSDDEAARKAESLIPQGSCDRAVWRKHATYRDERLTHLLNNLPIGGE